MTPSPKWPPGSSATEGTAGLTELVYRETVASWWQAWEIRSRGQAGQGWPRQAPVWAR